MLRRSLLNNIDRGQRIADEKVHQKQPQRHWTRPILYLLAAGLLIVTLWFAVFNHSPSRYRCDMRPPPHPCDKDYDIPFRVAVVGGAAILALGMVWAARRSG